MDINIEAMRVLHLANTFGVPTLIAAAVAKLKFDGKHDAAAELIALAGGAIANAYGVSGGRDRATGERLV